MRNFLEKTYAFFVFMKVGVLCLGALFLLFWFYRFFNLPFTQTLAPIFDLPTKLFPLPLETFEIYENHEVQNAYFVDGIVCAIIAFIFWIFEKISLELQRRYEIFDVRRKSKLEKLVNEELKQEYEKDVFEYKYYSILLSFKTAYVSEVLGQGSKVTPDSALELAYTLTVRHLKKVMPSLIIKTGKNTIFILGKSIEEFEKVLTQILNVIVAVKNENKKSFIDTDFIIVCDSQKTQDASLASFSTLNKIANSDYYNKAIVTLPFKIRFEFLKSEKFRIDILGTSATDKSDDDEALDIYILKSIEEKE